jgi:hypothetical protein
MDIQYTPLSNVDETMQKQNNNNHQLIFLACKYARHKAYPLWTSRGL